MSRVPRTVVVLGFVSFFNDFASDIVIPIVPLLLATVLAAGPAALGVIEGVAEAVASFLKLWAGHHTDVTQGRRKSLVFSGYLLSNVARPLLAIATSWVGVLALRGVDRVGKGIRSAPRDAMIADVVSVENAGRAYGLHRALDNAGAVLGGLAAAALLAWFADGDLRVALWFSVIPGVIGLVLLAVGVRDVERPASAIPPVRQRLAWGPMSITTRRFLLVLGFMAFARISETFVMMLGHQLGRSPVELLVLWSMLSLVRALAAYAGGRRADDVGRASVLSTSWLGYACAFGGFAVASEPVAFWAVSLLYGAILGFGEGAERAAISDFAPPHERGTAFGWYYLVVGVAAIPAGIAFGALWQLLGAGVAYGFSAAVAAAGVLLLRRWVVL